jgi:hypothetical protein
MALHLPPRHFNARTAKWPISKLEASPVQPPSLLALPNMLEPLAARHLPFRLLVRAAAVLPVQQAQVRTAATATQAAAVAEEVAQTAVPLVWAPMVQQTAATAATAQAVLEVGLVGLEQEVMLPPRLAQEVRVVPLELAAQALLILFLTPLTGQAVVVEVVGSPTTTAA